MAQQMNLLNSLEVAESYRLVGQLVTDMEEPLLILDPMLPGSPIVGASGGSLALTGRTLEELIGSEVENLSEGVPNAWLSQSSRRNLASFCKESARPDVEAMAEALIVQPQARKDASIYTALMVAGFCLAPCPGGMRRYVACAVVPVAEGFQPPRKAKETHLQVIGHAALSRAKAKVEALPCQLVHAGRRLAREKDNVEQPSFGFFTGRLEGHVIVANGGMTAARRESEELPTGCILFGDRPAPQTGEGLCFKVRVGSTTSAFQGLPFLGFTTRRPTTEAGSYTLLSKCLAESVVVGGCGEAFARDQSTNYVMGFKPPPDTEIQKWTLQAGLPAHRLETPTALRSGDEIECRYTWGGRVQYFLNDSMLMDFDTGRPVKADSRYYAVVDVCFAATSLTLVPLQATQTASIKMRVLSTMAQKDYHASDVSTMSNNFECQSSLSSSNFSEIDEDEDDMDNASDHTSVVSSITGGQVIMRQYACAMYGVGVVDSMQSLPSLTMDSLPPLPESSQEY